MSDPVTHEALIGSLAQQLRPVRRMAPPGVLAALWCGAVLVAGLGLASVADLAALRARLMFVPDMWLAVVGSAATAVLAAVAAFQTSVPGRHRLWVLLPLPSALLWIGASGLGCLRAWVVPGTHDAVLTESKDCLMFILATSLPLSALTLLLLRRGFSLHPGRTALLAGVAVAAAAATLLNLFHPYDAAATDLTVHVVAVGLVVWGNRLWGGRILARGRL